MAKNNKKETIVPAFLSNLSASIEATQDTDGAEENGTAKVWLDGAGLVSEGRDDLKDLTPMDRSLRVNGKPSMSTDTRNAGNVKHPKTKIYDPAKRRALLETVAGHCRNFNAECYVDNATVNVNYWPTRNIYTLSSAKKDGKAYHTEKGKFAFAAVKCDSYGKADTESVYFGNVRDEL